MRKSTSSGAIIAALLGLSGAGDARERSNRLTGIFSNVQLSAVTGDLGGLEIEIDADAPQPFATVVYCEGWCNSAHRVPIKLNGNEFELSFAEPYYDESGKLTGSNAYRLRGRLSGAALIAELQSQQLQAEPWRETFQLQRQQTRFGIDVAMGGKVKP